MERLYICIDLKSYYASVECVARGLDPLKAPLLVADETRSDKTICLAVSPSLKALGVPGRPRLFEARQKIAEAEARLHRKIPVIVAMPRMQRYVDVSTQIYGIYLRFVAPEDIHVYSIDECFIDATPYLPPGPDPRVLAQELARDMIRSVLADTGITATAGIGTNLYLAKVAMDIVAKHAVPDADGVRMAFLDETAYREQLWAHEPLTDFWQIGRGTWITLHRYGILTMGDVARTSIANEEFLYQKFGINAELLIDHAWGLEPCTMADVKRYRPQANSVSTGQVLPRPYTFEEARTVIQEMADQLAYDLMRKRLCTTTLSLYVGFDHLNVDDGTYSGPVRLDFYDRIVPVHASGTAKLSAQTNHAEALGRAAVELFDSQVNRSLSIRRLGLCAANVQSEDGPLQLDLFTDYDEIEKERRVQEAVLGVRSRFGSNALLKGTSYLAGATARERNGQIGGHRA